MEEEKVEEKKLTFKQRKFLDEYLKCGNAAEAAMRSYDCKDRMSARNIGSENLAKLGIKDEIGFWLDEYGITDGKLAEKIRDGLEANRTISTISGKEANGGTVDFVDVPDWNARNKVLEIVLKGKGKMRDKTKYEFGDDVSEIKISVKK